MKKVWSLLSIVLLLTACASAPEKVAAPVDVSPSWSINRVVHTDHSMITLLDPSDLVHHQAEPADWFLHDFAIKDDLQTGRFAVALTERPGKFNVRVTFGELTEVEQQVAGPVAKMRLRVINHRLLLSGGDAWPSVETDHRRFAHDQRWIGVPNGDYGVIITALKPGAVSSDYVFQLIRVNDMQVVKHAPGVPQLIYGQPATVVGVNAKGFAFHEQCLDVPGTASWVPLSSRTMPIPGATEAIVLPRSVNPGTPIVLSRNPEVGAFGFYLKPRNGNNTQVRGDGESEVSTLVRCAVQITGVDASPNDFSLQIKAVPTANDRLPNHKKAAVIKGFNQWLQASNDPAWRFKSAKVERSTDDAAMILGMVDYLELSSKESEQLLPMSNALRVDYLLDRFK